MSKALELTRKNAVMPFATDIVVAEELVNGDGFRIEDLNSDLLVLHFSEVESRSWL